MHQLHGLSMRLMCLIPLLISTILASPAPDSGPGPGSGSTVTITASPTSSPSTVTITATPTIPSTAPQFTNRDLFFSAVLNSTNLYRSVYNATALSWNKTLADFASSYLNSMGPNYTASGAECDFLHSAGPYGENLAVGCNDVTGCIDLWADEEVAYNYSDPGFSEATGHFTQLVWKNTTAVGCGSRLCGTRGWFLVCEYWPKGNVEGEFGTEVGRPVNGRESLISWGNRRPWVGSPWCVVPWVSSVAWMAS